MPTTRTTAALVHDEHEIDAWHEHLGQPSPHGLDVDGLDLDGTTPCSWSTSSGSPTLCSFRASSRAVRR